MLKKIILLSLAAILLLSACMNNRNTQPQTDQTVEQEENLTLEQQEERDVQTGSIVLNIDGEETREAIKTYIVNNEVYLPLSSVLETIGYQVDISEDNKTLKAGSTDVIYTVKEGDSSAVVEETNLPLASPAKQINNELCVTRSALQDLMSISYDVDVSNDEVHITTVLENLFVANDDIANVPDLTDEVEPEGIGKDLESLANSKANNIISTARRFMGTPYVFGAKSGVTSRFDCSSFTQYVFRVHGIRLPRTSRAQARMGQPVSASNLRRGDLVFFAWPGRYRSNRIVGHVGIYMGNGYVIHTTPGKGVHIVNAARSDYWRRYYLGARRV